MEIFLSILLVSISSYTFIPWVKDTIDDFFRPRTPVILPSDGTGEINQNGQNNRGGGTSRGQNRPPVDGAPTEDNSTRIRLETELHHSQRNVQIQQNRANEMQERITELQRRLEASTLSAQQAGGESHNHILQLKAEITALRRQYELQNVNHARDRAKIEEQLLRERPDPLPSTVIRLGGRQDEMEENYVVIFVERGQPIFDIAPRTHGVLEANEGGELRRGTRRGRAPAVNAYLPEGTSWQDVSIAEDTTAPNRMIVTVYDPRDRGRAAGTPPVHPVATIRMTTDSYLRISGPQTATPIIGPGGAQTGHLLQDGDFGYLELDGRNQPLTLQAALQGRTPNDRQHSLRFLQENCTVIAFPQLQPPLNPPAVNPPVAPPTVNPPVAPAVAPQPAAALDNTADLNVQVDQAIRMLDQLQSGTPVTGGRLGTPVQVPTGQLVAPVPGGPPGAPPVPGTARPATPATP